MDDQHQEIPEELQKAHDTKEIQAEAAKDAVEKEISRGELFLSSVGYISFLCILPLVLQRESAFAQHHGKQGLVLAIFIYFMDILNIMPARFAFLYTVLKIGLVLFCVVSAFKGKMFKLPFVYDLSQRFNISIAEKKTNP